jgi:hypothetical protein
MGSIIVETSQGPVQVDIAGETPTEKEQQAIISQFSNQQVSQTEIDFATASSDEIRDYARQRRALGIDPVSGKQLTEEEYISTYKEPGVDYRTGVDSIGGFSRFQFGRMDNDAERANYLRTVVGDEGYRQDDLGRFILTGEGRNKLGLGEGRELAIDEEGFSFNDVKEFFGATALPIAAGVGAGLMASGVGFIPGSLIVGAATAGGKLLDEGIEAAQGLQMQSAGEIARDAAFEGAFGAAGEGVGRGISKIFGRLIKGPGGEANEALRAQAREVINKGYRPTIAGATDESFRPILNRLQAVYEGVFPNKKAADINLATVIDDLRALGLKDETAINNLDEIVKRDIDNFYSTSDEALARAQRNMDDAVKNELDTIMKNLKDGESIPKDLNDMIRQRKAVFDEDVDRLYTKVTETLRGQQIIPTAGIKAALKELEENSVADVGSTKFAAQIRGLDKFATAQEVGRIRTGLTDASYNPALLNDVNVGALGSLKGAVNQAFDEAEISLAQMKNLGPIPAGASVTLPEGFSLKGVSIEDAGNALSLLSRTNKLYRNGVKRFDNVTVQNIVKQAQNGQMNMKFLFDKIIQEDNPEAFRQLMKAVRGVPTGKVLGTRTGIVDLDEGARILKTQRIGNRTVEQALKDVANLADNDPTKRMVLSRVAAMEREAAERATIRGQGQEMADQVRQGLAKMYLEKQLSRSIMTDAATGERIIDPVKLVANLREKGTVVDDLLGTDKKALDDIMTVLERGKSNLAPGVIQQLRSKPLGQALFDFQAEQAKRAGVDKNVIMNTLRSTSDPEVIAQTVFKTPSSIKQAKEFLPAETMESVRDASMGRILKQIGATVDEAGEIRMTDDFVEAFKSGRLGNKLQSVLRSYGPETIDAMFQPGASKALNEMAETMVRASNAAITGKGGLAAPQIALGLGVVSFIMNPLATLPTALAYSVMSKALRNPKVLKMMMASRKPNSVKQFLSGKFKANDPLAQGFQTMWQLAGAATIQGGRMLTGQAQEEARPAMTAAKQQLDPMVQQTIQAAQTMAPQVTPPASGTPSQVSPLLVPDPTTRATFGIQ